MVKLFTFNSTNVISYAFEIWCWRRLLRVPWTARRSNQSILKKISPGISLEGMRLKLKLQYFGLLMRRVDSLEKTLMLGGIGGRRRRGRQRMRWLDGITDQSCPTLCDPIDGSPPGSPVPGILQARTLKWVAISFSNAWKWKMKEKSLSRVRLFATPWTAAYQAPPSMGFSRQEYWSGWPLPSLNQVYEPLRKIITGLEADDQVYSLICDQWL